MTLADSIGSPVERCSQRATLSGNGVARRRCVRYFFTNGHLDSESGWNASSAGITDFRVR